MGSDGEVLSTTGQVLSNLAFGMMLAIFEAYKPKLALTPGKRVVDSMSSTIRDELTGMIMPEDNRYAGLFRHSADTVIGTLIIMILFLGIILAFLMFF